MLSRRAARVPARSSMRTVPPWTLAQARTAASPLLRSIPPPSSALYRAKAGPDVVVRYTPGMTHPHRPGPTSEPAS